MDDSRSRENGEASSAHASAALTWRRVASADEVPEGRVKSVSAGTRTIALTRYEGKWGALDNACPHQGGPLGEGSIEKGCLRCPWHGWDFHPLTGKSPGGYDDGVETYPVEERPDGVYVGVPGEAAHVRTVSGAVHRWSGSRSAGATGGWRRRRRRALAGRTVRDLAPHTRGPEGRAEPRLSLVQAARRR